MINTIRTYGCGTAYNELEHKIEQVSELKLGDLERNYVNAKHKFFISVNQKLPLQKQQELYLDYELAGDIYFKAKEKVRERIR